MRAFAITLLGAIGACSGAAAPPPAMPAQPSLQNVARAEPREDARRELTAAELEPREVRASDDEIKRRLVGTWIGRVYDPQSLRPDGDHQAHRFELRLDGTYVKTLASCEIAGRWLLEHHTPESVELVVRHERHCNPKLATYSYPLSIRRLDADLLVLDIGPTGSLEGYRRDR